MKTSMSIIVFFVVVLSISATSLAKMIPVESCIRRNIEQTLAPSPSNKPKTSPYEIIIDKYCRDEARIITYFLKLKEKFPHYYVKALCNVFGDKEEKVKEYVIKEWLNPSKKLIESLSCVASL